MEKMHHLLIAKYFGSMKNWAEKIFAPLHRVKRFRYEQTPVPFENAVLTVAATKGEFSLGYIYKGNTEKSIQCSVNFMEPFLERHFKDNRPPNEIEVGDNKEYLPRSLVLAIDKLRNPNMPIICTETKHLIVGLHQLEEKKRYHSDLVEIRYLPTFENTKDIKNILSNNTFFNEFEFSIFQRVLVGIYIERLLGERRGKSRPNAIQWHDLSMKSGELAASLTGFKSPTTYHRAKSIYKFGDDRLLVAIEKNDISISKAYFLLKKNHKNH